MLNNLKIQKLRPSAILEKMAPSKMAAKTKKGWGGYSPQPPCLFTFEY
jgi:hypothetical protein